MKQYLLRAFVFLFLSLLFTSTTGVHNVVCVGSPCLDLILSVDEQTIQKVAPEKGGSRPVDYLTFTNILRYSKSKPKVSLGGSALNVARVLAHLGQECAFVGKVGSDEADSIFQSLAKNNVDALLLKSATPTTRVCCLITPDGQRTMRVFIGASSEELDIQDIRFSCLENTGIVHLEGYLLYVKDGEFVKKVIKKAKESGAKVSFDCASYEVVAKYKKIIMSLLESKSIDIIFANEDENNVLTNLVPSSGCKELQKFCSIAVVTAGKNGCWVGNSGEIIHVPALPTTVIDTTGAGDFFEGGFLYGYINGMDLRSCAQCGTLLGQAAVSVFGTSLSTTRWKEIKRQLQKY